jgi:hypothetical protein
MPPGADDRTEARRLQEIERSQPGPLHGGPPTDGDPRTRAPRAPSLDNESFASSGGRCSGCRRLSQLVALAAPKPTVYNTQEGRLLGERVAATWGN